MARSVTYLRTSSTAIALENSANNKLDGNAASRRNQDEAIIKGVDGQSQRKSQDSPLELNQVGCGCR